MTGEDADPAAGQFVLLTEYLTYPRTFASPYGGHDDGLPF